MIHKAMLAYDRAFKGAEGAKASVGGELKTELQNFKSITENGRIFYRVYRVPCILCIASGEPSKIFIFAVKHFRFKTKISLNLVMNFVRKK